VIVRSTYLVDANARFYEYSLRLWEGLSAELNFIVMFSQRGLYNLFHSTGDREVLVRRPNAMRLNGMDGELIDHDQLKSEVPDLDVAHLPVLGAVVRRRGGVARHDAMVWGFALAAIRFGVNIIQNCEVTAVRCEAGYVRGVDTTLGSIDAPRVGLAGGHNAVFDLRSAYATFWLSGNAAEELLYRGCSVPLDRPDFAPGGCMTAKFGRLTVIIHRLDVAQAFDLHRQRRLALSLWGCLAEAGRDCDPSIAFREADRAPDAGFLLEVQGWYQPSRSISAATTSPRSARKSSTR
jgi:hypothetical protein